MEKSLKSMGVTGELLLPSHYATSASPADLMSATLPTAVKRADAPPSPEMEALLKDAAKVKAKASDADDFWSQAAEKHGNKPVNSEVMSLEEARKLGLIPGDGK